MSSTEGSLKVSCKNKKGARVETRAPGERLLRWQQHRIRSRIGGMDAGTRVDQTLTLVGFSFLCQSSITGAAMKIVE